MNNFKGDYITNVNVNKCLNIRVLSSSLTLNHFLSPLSPNLNHLPLFDAPARERSKKRV